jgi:hypothetical protein
MLGGCELPAALRLLSVKRKSDILSQDMHLTGVPILALTAKLTQTVPRALRSRRSPPKLRAFSWSWD